MTHTMAVQQTPSPTVHAHTPQGLHALQGLEMQPREINPSVMKRLLVILAAAAALKENLGKVYQQNYHYNLKETNRLADDTRYNMYWQAATHLATAFGTIAIGLSAAELEIDVPSAISMATKTDDTITTFLRAKETHMSHTKQQIDHKISKGSEGDKRLAEFLQQLMQGVRSYMEQHSQQMKAH